MNKDKDINKKVLKEFLNLMDKDMDVKSCLSKFPEDRKSLEQYAAIIEGLKNLKNVRTSNDFEENSLKNIYLRSRIEKIESQKKDFKKDMFLIRLRPAYLKPLIIFLAVFIFISFSFTGTIYASSNSVPGELLYSVKRASEDVLLYLTPYKDENTIYIKMLNSRLREADIILNKDDFTDTKALEKLVLDIDNTYRSCINRNYFDENQDMQIQNRIGAVKEGFKKRYGIGKNNTSDFSDKTIKDVQNNANSNTGMQDFEKDSSQSNNKCGEVNNNSLNSGKQNQKNKHNQFGKN